MPVLVFDLVAVTGDSDRFDSAFVNAPKYRAAVKSPGVVTPRKIQVPAPEGKESVWVEPGPVDVTLKSGGKREVLRLNVPDVDTVYLSDLMGSDAPVEATEVDRIWEAIRGMERTGGPVDFDSLTAEQRELLRGPKGDKGDAGETTVIRQVVSWDWEGDGPPPDPADGGQSIPGSQPGDIYYDRVAGELWRL